MKKITNLLFAALLIPSAVLQAQDGHADLSFNNPVHLNPSKENGFTSNSTKTTVYSTCKLSDGRIAVYGDFKYYQGIAAAELVILQQDGTLDTSFNPGSTGADNSPSYISPDMIAQQSDGKIIIVGGFNNWNNIPVKKIVRFNTDGTLDTTFNPGTSAHGFLNCVKIQPDGKILCGGEFDTFNDQNYSSIVRLNSDGSVDTTFNIGTGITNTINSFTDPGFVQHIILQPDNKILVGGFFLKYNNTLKINLVRLNSDGSLDTTFNIGNGLGTNLTDGSYNGRVMNIAYQPQTNKIYLAGSIFSFNAPNKKSVIRLNQDGTTDTNFNLFNVFDEAHTINILDNDKILVGGIFESGTNRNLILLNNTGLPDDTFHFKAIGPYEEVNSVLPVDNGIFVAGSFEAVNYGHNLKGSMVKINLDGSTDLSFNPNMGLTSLYGECYGSFSFTDGKILVSPEFVEYITDEGENPTAGLYNERLTRGVVKINGDGSIDQTTYEAYETLAKQGETITAYGSNKALVCGGSASYKINEDGTLDNTFANTVPLVLPNTMNFNQFVEAQLIQPDGKAVIAGNFTYAVPGVGNMRRRIMRLNTDGTLDATFNIGNGFNSESVAGTEGYYVRALDNMPDNKIIAAGTFTKFHTTDVKNIVRINSNGTIDNTFNSGTSFNSDVLGLKYQNSIDKIIACGKFTSYNGQTSNYIVRLDANGAIDPTFTSPFSTAETWSHLTNVIALPDGKYLVSGIMESGNQILKRLNANGSFDASFYNDNVFTDENNNYSEYDMIKHMTVLPDKRILISGYFTHMNDIRRNGIAVIENSYILSIEEFEDQINSIVVYPNPASDKLTIQTLEMVDKAEVYTIEGRLVKTVIPENNQCNISDLPSGIYLLKATTNHKSISAKFIKK